MICELIINHGSVINILKTAGIVIRAPLKSKHLQYNIRSGAHHIWMDGAHTTSSTKSHPLETRPTSVDRQSIGQHLRNPRGRPLHDERIEASSSHIWTTSSHFPFLIRARNILLSPSLLCLIGIHPWLSCSSLTFKIIAAAVAVAASTATLHHHRRPGIPW